jgi:predicted transcriptional regulator
MANQYRDGTYKREGDSIVTVPVSPELHRKLRVLAASEGRTIKWLLTKAIEQLVAEGAK